MSLSMSMSELLHVRSESGSAIESRSVARPAQLAVSYTVHSQTRGQVKAMAGSRERRSAVAMDRCVKAGRTAVLRVATRGALLMLLAATGAAMLASDAHAQSSGCDGRNPGTFDPNANYSPANPVSVWGRVIELRTNTGDPRCVWARLQNGRRGDAVWLDRSPDRGRTWRQIETAHVFRGTQTYTVTRSVPWPSWIRACGKAKDRREVACTVWYG